jgi:hypothetical protein
LLEPDVDDVDVVDEEVTMKVLLKFSVPAC